MLLTSWSNYFRCIADPSIRRDTCTVHRLAGKFRYEGKCTVECRRSPKYWPDTGRNSLRPASREDNGTDLRSRGKQTPLLLQCRTWRACNLTNRVARLTNRTRGDTRRRSYTGCTSSCSPLRTCLDEIIQLRKELKRQVN